MPEGHSVIITGIKKDSTALDSRPEPRLEINELIRNDKQWALYVQALLELQDVVGRTDDDRINPVSWFGIASVHGAPFKTWDNAPPVQLAAIDKESNYCAHASNVFPTWHRVYLALFEQEVHQAAVAIAKLYTTDQANWLDAAARLRIPYWDWATHVMPPKEVMELAELLIETPTGLETRRNPLYSYIFHQQEFSSLPDDWNTSTRRDQRVRAALKAAHVNDALRNKVYKMLIQQNGWSGFANRMFNKKHGVQNSIEIIHDEIHIDIGGERGHMGKNEYAAYDPLFWLHHANVDRLLALWQTLHNNIWVPPHADNTDDANTDLLPFWNGEGPSDFFKSSDPSLRNWQALNYTYPEFINIPVHKDDQRDAISKIVKTLYGTGGPTRKLAETNNDPAGSILLESLAPSVSMHSFSTQVSGVTHEWHVRIRSIRFSINMPFTVLVFLGEPPVSAADWRDSDKFIGKMSILVNTSPESCANCLNNMVGEEVGYVDMTQALVDRGIDVEVAPSVEEFLQANLYWRVQKIDGSCVIPSEGEGIPGLQAEVLQVAMAWSELDSCFVPVTGNPILSRVELNSKTPATL